MQQYPINLENLSKHLQNNVREDDINWWSIPRGTSSIRMLPPWDATGRIALQVFQHRIEYRDDSMSYTKYNWTCSEKSFGTPCPICQALGEMKMAGVDTEEYEASRRVFYSNVMVMYDADYESAVKAGRKPESGYPSGTIVIARIPKTIYDWVVTQITNPLVGDLTSFEAGIDLYVTKEGQGLGTTYSVTTSPNGRTAIPQQFLEGKSLYDLSNIFSQGHDEKLLESMLTKIRNSANNIAQSVPSFNPVQYAQPGYPPQQFAPPQQYTPAPQYAQPAQQYAPTTIPPQYVQPTHPQSPSPQIPSTPMAPVPPPTAQFVPNPVQVVSAPPPPMVPNLQPPTPPGQVPIAQPVLQPPQQMSMDQMIAPAVAAPQAEPQTLQVAMNASNPKCFGNYNPSDVTCVVCPSEIECTRASAK